MDNGTLLSSTIGACKNSSFAFSVSGWPAVAAVGIVASCIAFCRWMTLDYQKHMATQEK